MNEREFREQLLSADLEELRGEGESAVARRVRADASARAAADRILADVRAMDARLAGIDASFARDGATYTPANARTPRRARGGQAEPSWSRRPHTRVIGLAFGLAAAAVAALLVVRPQAPAPAPPLPQAMAAAAPEPPLTASLAVESDRRFAVFATDNPNIAVVWLFNEQEGQ